MTIEEITLPENSLLFRAQPLKCNDLSCRYCNDTKKLVVILVMESIFHLE